MGTRLGHLAGLLGCVLAAGCGNTGDVTAPGAAGLGAEKLAPAEVPPSAHGWALFHDKFSDGSPRTRTLEFHADTKLAEMGRRVTGWGEIEHYLYQGDEGYGRLVRSWGFDIDCLCVDKGVAIISGESTWSSPEGTMPVGTPFWFRVADNGDGTDKAKADQVSGWVYSAPGEDLVIPACDQSAKVLHTGRTDLRELFYIERGWVTVTP